MPPRKQQNGGGGGERTRGTGLQRGPPPPDDLFDDDAEGSLNLDAVVKVFAQHAQPNWSLPWQRQRQTASTSSAFCIEGRRVLTNAHCVDWASSIKLKHRGSDTKYLATVEAIAIECDLAVLTVEDDEFWATVEPIKLGRLPRLHDNVTVVGFPTGGDTISITSGVVSRIEMLAYSHGATDLLGVQIDAAINSGNSGGPVFDDSGLCVGVAFQVLRGGGPDHMDQPEAIGYVIPVPVIQHLLDDVARNGGYTGFPSLGCEWQKLENASLRKSLGLDSAQKGVLVRRMEPTAPSSAVMSGGDVLLSIDDQPIACDGTVSFRRGERVCFSNTVTSKLVGESVTLKIWSQGAAKTVKCVLAAPSRLVPVHTLGKPPSYYVFAGLVFTQVVVPFLRSEYGEHYQWDSPVKLLNSLLHGQRRTPDEQVVVLSQVLASAQTLGFEDLLNLRVQSVNGQPITNLRQLVTLVEGCDTRFLTFDLDHHTKVVLETAAARAATPELLETHSIPSAASADLHGLLRDAPPALAPAAAVAAAAAVVAPPPVAAAAAAGKAEAPRKRAAPHAAAGGAASEEPEPAAAAKPATRRRG